MLRVLPVPNPQVSYFFQISDVFPLILFRRMLSGVGTANKYIYNLLTCAIQELYVGTFGILNGNFVRVCGRCIHEKDINVQNAKMS